MALAWLSQHQQVLGLAANEPEQSLRTCVRELFENALDACESTDGEGEHTINVAVADVSGVPGKLYRVQVSDDGVGFQSEDILDHLSEAFSSTKAARTAATDGELGGPRAGIFGLGLKSVLLWANASGGGEVRVSTTARNSQHVLSVTVRLTQQADQVHQMSNVLKPVTRLERLPKPDRARCGTRVTAVLSGGDKGLERVREYFLSMGALWVTSPLQIRLSLGKDVEPFVTRISPMAIGTMCDSSQPSPPLLGALAFLESTLPINEAARDASNSTEQVPATLLQAHGSECAALDGNSFVHVTALLLSGAKALPKRRGAEVGCGGVGLWVLLLLNNKPLRCDGSLEPNCAGASGLRKARYWRELGLSLRASGAERSLRLVAVEGGRSLLRQVRLCVHVRSPAGGVKFADLTKTWLAADPRLASAIGSALDGALAEAHHSLAARGVLLSKAERKESELRESAARIAASVGNLLARCSLLPSRGDESELFRHRTPAIEDESNSQDMAQIELTPAAVLRCVTSATVNVNHSGSSSNAMARAGLNGGEALASNEATALGRKKRQKTGGLAAPLAYDPLASQCSSLSSSSTSTAENKQHHSQGGELEEGASAHGFSGPADSGPCPAAVQHHAVESTVEKSACSSARYSAEQNDQIRRLLMGSRSSHHQPRRV